jgi:hypothetical protein
MKPQASYGARQLAIPPSAPQLAAMQNAMSVSIMLFGLALAIAGAWLTWGTWSTLVVVGGALFAFGLASID